MFHKDDCIFCQIVTKKIPATIRYEDEEFLAFDDIHPAAPQHILIIPKEHVDSLESWAVENSEKMGRLLKTARAVTRAANITDNYKLFMNVGPQVQIVHHLHLHVMGGWKKGSAMHINAQEM